MIINDYLLTKKIGKGTYSEIYLSMKKGYNVLYATKKYERQLILGTEYFKSLNNEIKYAQNFNNDDIIKLHNVLKTKNNFYIIYEYCNGGDLSTIVDNYQLKYGQPFSEEIVQHLMRQVINGLKYIHDKNLIHGDIKLNSILVHFDTEKDKKELNMMKGKIKISHFKFVNKSHYPELNNNVKSQTNDIFNLGLMCYKMIFGKYGHYSEDYEKLINDIQAGKYYYPIILSKEILLFMKNMLTKNYNERLKIGELSHHVFLTKNFRTLQLHNFMTNNQNEIKIRHLCMFCSTRPPQIIISPCGHKCVCDICYINLKRTNNLNNCPVCGMPIISVVKKVFEV